MAEVGKNAAKQRFETETNRIRRQLDKAIRIRQGYPVMRRVVEYFYETCPFEISNDEREQIEKELFNGKGTKSTLGTINFLAQQGPGNRWPGWVEMAKSHFDIDY